MAKIGGNDGFEEACKIDVDLLITLNAVMHLPILLVWYLG